MSVFDDLNPINIINGSSSLSPAQVFKYKPNLSLPSLSQTGKDWANLFNPKQNPIAGWGEGTVHSLGSSIEGIGTAWNNIGRGDWNKGLTGLGQSSRNIASAGVEGYIGQNTDYQNFLRDPNLTANTFGLSQNYAGMTRGTYTGSDSGVVANTDRNDTVQFGVKAGAVAATILTAGAASGWWGGGAEAGSDIGGSEAGGAVLLDSSYDTAGAGVSLSSGVESADLYTGYGPYLATDGGYGVTAADSASAVGGSGVWSAAAATASSGIGTAFGQWFGKQALGLGGGSSPAPGKPGGGGSIGNVTLPYGAGSGSSTSAPGAVGIPGSGGKSNAIPLATVAVLAGAAFLLVRHHKRVA